MGSIWKVFTKVGVSDLYWLVVLSYMRPQAAALSGRALTSGIRKKGGVRYWTPPNRAI